MSLDLGGPQWKASDNDKNCKAKKVERTFDVLKGEMNASTVPLNGSSSRKFSTKLSASDNNVSQQKLQQHQHQVGVSTDSLKSNYRDLDRSKLRQKRLSSLGTQLNGQFTSQHVHHHSSVSFSKSGYAAFKKGNIVRGILCPSLTNSFR